MNRVLLIGGGFRDRANGNHEMTQTVEVVQLGSSNQQPTCALPDFPTIMRGGVGFTTTQGPVVCGGDVDNDDFTKECYILKAKQWSKWNDLTIERANANAIKINDQQTLILGGRRNDPSEGWKTLQSSDLMSANGAEESGVLPWTYMSGCSLKVNSTTYLITGGWQGHGQRSYTQYVINGRTWYLNLETMSMTQGPRMAIVRSDSGTDYGRSGHACTSFQLGNKHFAVVTGGSTGRGTDTTEFLDLESSNPVWFEGMNFRNGFFSSS